MVFIHLKKITTFNYWITATEFKLFNNMTCKIKAHVEKIGIIGKREVNLYIYHNRARTSLNDSERVSTEVYAK